MFRHEFHDPDDAFLRDVSRGAFGVLLEGIEAMGSGELGGADPMHVAMRAWALVHGLATLWHDGLISVFTDQDLKDLALAIFEIGEEPG
jgi:hypothetical protein